MRSKTLILLAMTLLLGLGCMAQQTLQRADRALENLNFPKAERLYRKALVRQADGEVASKLAKLLLRTGHADQAATLLAPWLKGKNSQSEWALTYAQALQGSGKFGEAEKWYLQYAEEGDFPDEARQQASACAALALLKPTATGYALKPAPFNTEVSEIGAMSDGEGVILTANGQQGGILHPLDPTTGASCYDIVALSGADFARKGLPGRVNSRWHEGPCTRVTREGKIYFTRSNFVKGKYGRDQQGGNQLQILEATLDNGKWKQVKLLPFNQPDYSTGHPSLSADGQQLYFASNRPGGYGGSDIYVVARQGEGWGTPENLGPAVNSSGEELFPYIRQDGSLFFASNGRQGMGGLDLYHSASIDGVWQDASNLGAPINSVSDDFAMYWDATGLNGYLSSNRAGGRGSDDAYRFTQSIWIDVEAWNAQLSKPVTEVAVRVVGSRGTTKELLTDSVGHAGFFAGANEDFKLQLSHPKYVAGECIVQSATATADGRCMQRVAMRLRPAVDGMIVDKANGKPLADAQVQLLAGAKRLTMPLDDHAAFAYLGDSAATYKVLVTRAGYKPVVTKLTCVSPAHTKPTAIKMEAGDFVLLEGKAVDAATDAPLADVKVRVMDSTAKDVVDTDRSLEDGSFFLSMPRSGGHLAYATHEGYFVAHAPLQPSIAAGMPLKMPLVAYKVGETVKIIHFDYKSAAIKDGDRPELNEIVLFMEANPEASIEIASHTDCRGGNASNLELSQQRAKASMDYIVQHKINPKRLAAKGYGEEIPVNGCKDDAPCDELLHAQNRRSEFRITKIQNEKQ